MNVHADLARHSGWLRALARSLVGDSQTADDLVQDTWAAALLSPYEHEARPWLGRVLRNMARQRFRAEARRLRRERAAAHDELLLSTAELATRMELQGTLIELVQALDQPYRETIVLRYYEGLSAAEIGRRKGIPGATVRSHLKRGLDELRTRLDERHAGGREAWSALLLPWLNPKASIAVSAGSAATALIHGTLTMSTGAKLVLGAAVAILAFVGYRQAHPAALEREQVEVLAGSPASTQAAAEEVLVHSEESVTEGRSAIVVPPGPPSEPGPGVAAYQVTAAIVDEHLDPIAHAVLSIAALGAASEPTQSDGLAQITPQLAKSGRYTIEVACAGYATNLFTAILDPVATMELGLIVLQPGGRITGIVVDHEDSPIVGAEVIVTPRVNQLLEFEMMRRVGPDRYRGVMQGRSDLDGRFVIDGVAARAVRVWAGAIGKLWAASELLTIRADGSPTELYLQLELPATEELIEGIVLAPDGSPVADCTVRGDYRGPSTYFTRWTTTTADGHFSFLATKNVRTDLRAEDPEQIWSDAVLRESNAGGEAVLRFEETRTIALLVQDSDKGAVIGARVQAIARSERDSQEVGRGEPVGNEDGLYHLREPAESFNVRVRAAGYADYESGLFLQGKLPDPFVVTLTKLPGIHGVVSIGGLPAAKVRMKIARVLGEVAGSFQIVHHQGFQTELDPYAGFDFETDAEGRFAFAPQAAGDYAIRAEREGFAPGELRIFDYQPGRGMRGLEIQLDQGGAIEGELTPPSGNRVAGMRVVASRGDAHALVQRVGDDGIFRFAHLIPGRWNVEVIDDDLENLPTSHAHAEERLELPWVCEVFEGETTFHDLDLGGQALCSVAGHLTVDGAAAVGWTASLRSQASNSHRASENPQAVLDGSGRFELQVAKARPYLLSVQAPQGQAPLILYADLDLAEGQLEWELAVQTGSVMIDNIPYAENLKDLLFIQWTGPNGASARRRLEPDDNGRCTLERFPAGSIQIGRYTDSRSISGSASALLMGRVEPGQAARFKIP